MLTMAYRRYISIYAMKGIDMASNRYAGQCNMCSHAVPAGMGSIHRARRTWIVYCADCVPGAMPGSTATTFVGAGGASTVYQNPAGYCIDAPCCGCCTY